MPLLDHFQAPLSIDWPWDAFHSAWASAIATHLNQSVLPEDYYALPLAKRGSQIEIDVATLHREGSPGSDGGGTATAVWTPPRPRLSETVDFTDLDLFEVQVIRRFGGPQLRAAIELISPANKDRPSNRHAFAVKCGSYLNHGVSVVLVDVVTERSANMHAEVLEVLRLTGVPPWQSPTNLYVVSYRMIRTNGKHQLDAWPEALTLGAPLPGVPLWLEPDLPVRLQLEESYTAACKSLRMVP
jgi:hypothetical protein